MSSNQDDNGFNGQGIFFAGWLHKQRDFYRQQYRLRYFVLDGRSTAERVRAPVLSYFILSEGDAAAAAAKRTANEEALDGGDAVAEANEEEGSYEKGGTAAESSGTATLELLARTGKLSPRGQLVLGEGSTVVKAKVWGRKSKSGRRSKSKRGGHHCFDVTSREGEVYHLACASDTLTRKWLAHLEAATAGPDASRVAAAARLSADINEIVAKARAAKLEKAKKREQGGRKSVTFIDADATGGGGGGDDGDDGGSARKGAPAPIDTTRQEDQDEQDGQQEREEITPSVRGGLSFSVAASPPGDDAGEDIGMSPAREAIALRVPTPHPRARETRALEYDREGEGEGEGEGRDLGRSKQASGGSAHAAELQRTIARQRSLLLRAASAALDSSGGSSFGFGPVTFALSLLVAPLLLLRRRARALAAPPRILSSAAVLLIAVEVYRAYRAWRRARGLRAMVAEIKAELGEHKEE